MLADGGVHEVEMLVGVVVMSPVGARGSHFLQRRVYGGRSGRLVDKHVKQAQIFVEVVVVSAVRVRMLHFCQ